MNDNISEYFFDITRKCPECFEGGLRFKEIPENTRFYKTEEGEFTEHFGPVRDYDCKNCGVEFVLIEHDATFD